MKDYNYDIYRYYGEYKEKIKNRFFRPNSIKFIIIYRKYNCTNNIILKKYYKFKYKLLSKKTFIQIPFSVKIGKGFYIGHDGPLIINPNVVIGENVNIAVGATIGQENRGKRKGVPTIGNDVLIAPNSYVNFDVPSHSIVIGNPGKIIEKNNATKDYINRRV